MPHEGIGIPTGLKWPEGRVKARFDQKGHGISSYRPWLLGHKCLRL